MCACTPSDGWHVDCTALRMLTPYKLLQRTKGKKRWVLLALLGVELASLPAAALVVQGALMDKGETVTAVEIPTAEPGHSRYLVTSTAGFGVDAINLEGDVLITVHVSGNISGVSRFGDAAQLPGTAHICSESYNALGAPVYLAERTTAAQDGTAVERAVIFEMRYAADATPEFVFKPGTARALPPKRCLDQG
jgi:uncharacterized protein YuzE